MSDEDRKKFEAEREQWLEKQKMLEQKRVEQENLNAKLQQKQLQLQQQQQQLLAQQTQLEQQRKKFDEQRRNVTDVGSAQGLSARAQQVPSVSFFSTIGSLSEFHIGEDWDLYEERLSQYFIANNVPEERRVAVLITLVEQEAYKVLKDLCDPDLPAVKSYTELCEILRKQFASRMSVFKERIEFYNLRQDESETVNGWYARIKNKAINCKFGALLDDKIKDKFVTGLKSGPVLDKVCEQEFGATLNTILEAARNKEATLATISKSQTVDVNRVYSNSTKKFQRSGNKDFKKKEKKGSEQRNEDVTELKCRYCGGIKHSFAKCKYKTYQCKKCKKVGHLAKVCRSNGKVDSDHNYLEAENDESIEICDMFKIDSKDITDKPKLVELLVEEKKLEMEIDSGASKSVIPEIFFNKYLSHCKLEETSVRLKTYDGNLMIPLGQITVRIVYKKTEVQGKLVVVKNGCRPLMGRDLMNLLGFYIASINFLDENKEVQPILKKYAELFDNKLGKYKDEKIEIKLQENVVPIFIKPRAVPLALKKKLDLQLEKLEADKVITLQKNNSWGTPLVPILKEDGNIRVCADYKITVNRFVEDVKHPLPRIEELFAALSGGEKFTKLDLTAAYNQLELTEESKKLLAWSTHKGIYTINRLPFGVKPACAIFQKIMEKVLQGIEGVINFLDDIVVTGKNTEEHLNNLTKVFKRLMEAGFKLNLKKCSFFQSEIKYLGHIIDKNGLKKDFNKVAAIVKAPKPKNVQEVQAFIGMVNYYAKFVPKISEILSPLYQLIKEKNFNWSKECEESFQQSKKEMSAERFLTHFNPNLQIKLACDASKVGIGAVLLHILPDGSEKPIAYASRVLREAEKNYSVIHKEALAIFWAVNKFYQYLLGNEFILCSDHKPLQALFGENKGIPQMAAGRLQRWALFLSGFKYKFQYVKGNLNGGADGLSRLPVNIKSEEVEYKDYFHYLVEERVPVSAELIRKELRHDSILSKVYLYTRNGWPESTDIELKPFASRANEISLENGVIMWGYRVIVPKKLQSLLLEEIHNAHIGIVKMKALARQYFWWPKLDRDIEEYVKNCNACRSTAKLPEKASLIKFHEAKFPFERIHIDFLGPFEGKVYLLIIDAFSKWPEIFEMNKTDSTSTIEKLRECFARFGLPNLIISDNGRQFVSEEFTKFCETNGIAHRTSPPYHPATNGLAENAVGSFKRAIKRALVDFKGKPVKLSTLISRYLLVYRNIPHTTTGETPAKLMLGRYVKTRLDFLNKTTAEKARENQIKYFHGNREIDFETSETVYARDYKNPAKPTWQRSMVKEKLGNRTYIIEPENREGVLWKRHTDQLLKEGKFYNKELESWKENKIEEQTEKIEIEKEKELDAGIENAEKGKVAVEINESIKPRTEESREINRAPKEDLTVISEGNIAKATSNIPVRQRKSSMVQSRIDDSSNVNQRPKRIIKPVERLNL